MHGKTGRELLRAIRAGERAPQRLARHRARRCTHEQATLAKALEGHGRAAPRLALPQALEPYACMPPQVQACAQQLAAGLQTLVPPVEVETPQTTPARKRRARQRQAPRCDVPKYLDAMTGVDLTQMDGIEALTALQGSSAIGRDRTRWPTGKQLASWWGGCPGNKGSGGKRERLRSQPTANRAASA